MGYSLEGYFGGGNSLAYKAYKKGQAEGKWKDLPDYVAKGGTAAGTNTNDIWNKANTLVTDFTTEYGNAIKNKWDEVSKAYSVPGLQDVAQTSVEQLQDIPQNVITTSKQFGMSAPRIQQRIVGMTEKFAPTAQRAVSQAQTAVSNANDYFTRLMAPYEWKSGQVAAQVAAQLTGYTANMQSQLDTVLAKLKNGWAVDAQEAANAAEMAKLEKQYELALKNNLAYYNATKTSSNSEETFS